MDIQQHPITPPEELVRQWHDKWLDDECTVFSMFIATQAARWGADQELEACCKWLVAHGWFGSSNSGALCILRAARRPEPPSLAEQATTELQSHMQELRVHGLGWNAPTISAALERLKELEKGNE